MKTNRVLQNFHRIAHIVILRFENFGIKNIDMPTSCSAFGCSNHNAKPDCIERKVSFHNFPHSNPNLMKVWLVRLKRANFVPSKSTKLCSDHFDPKCFFHSGGNFKRILIKDAAPTNFSFTKTSKRKGTSCTMRCTEKETLDTDAVPTNISSVNHTAGQLYNDESEDEVNQLFNNSVDIQADDAETILIEDSINMADVSTEKSTKKKFHLIKQLKNDSSSQRLKEEARRISALKNRLMSTVMKRSLKRALLESEIKAAKARRDFYENKKSLLSLKTVESNTKAVPLSLTEQKILEDLKDEESAFKIEKSMLRKQLIEAEKKAAMSTKTYYEMKKSSLPTPNRYS